MAREQLCMHQALVFPGRAAGVGLFSSAPLYMGTAPAEPDQVSEEGRQTKKAVQAPSVCLHSHRAWLHMHSVYELCLKGTN